MLSILIRALLTSLKKKGPATFVSYAASSLNGSSSTLTINKPSGVQAGDLLVVILSMATSTSWTGDTGWQEEYDVATGGVNTLRVAWKIATGGEPSSYTFTAANSHRGIGQILAFRKAAFDKVGTAATKNPSNGTLNIPGITALKGIIVGFVGCGISGTPTTKTFSTPSGMTATANHINVEGTTGNGFGAFHQAVDAGATGNRSTTVGGLNSGTAVGLMVGIKDG